MNLPNISNFKGSESLLQGFPELLSGPELVAAQRCADLQSAFTRFDQLNVMSLVASETYDNTVNEAMAASYVNEAPVKAAVAIRAIMGADAAAARDALEHIHQQEELV